MQNLRQAARHRAFTLIEMMVVVVIIVLLVGLLLPAFSTVRTKARVTKTVALFAALDNGLTLFRNESSIGGAYPPSASDRPGSAGEFQTIANPRKNRPAEEPNNDGQDPIRIAGAHLLAHAMIGADFLGSPGFRDFDRDGFWWNDTHDGTGGGGADGAYRIDSTTGKEARTRYPSSGGAYVDEKAKQGVKSLRQIDESLGIPNLSDAPAETARDEPMFVDPWDMPVLYYRANPSVFRMTSDANNTGVYRQEDNGLITGTVDGIFNQVGLDFGPGPDPVSELFHAIAVATSPLPGVTVKEIEDLSGTVYKDSFVWFILDKKNRTRPTPVRKSSYLLISAGPDNRYGTADDVVNFSREVN